MKFLPIVAFFLISCSSISKDSNDSIVIDTYLKYFYPKYNITKENLKPLIDAVREGNSKEVQYILENNLANVNAPDASGNTALKVAIENQNLYMIDYLIQKGANGEKSYINIALKQGNTIIVDYLVSKEYSLDLLDEHSWGAGEIASYYGHIHLLGYLKEKKKISDFVSSIYLGTAQGHLDVVQLLIPMIKEEDPLIKQNLYDRLFLLSAQNGYLTLVQYYLSLGANLEGVNANGKTAYDLAYENNKVKVYDYLNALYNRINSSFN